MSDNKFGEIIKKARTEQDLSLAKLSKDYLESTIDPSYINRLEKGGDKQPNPSFKIVCSLCEALNIDIREVFQAFGFSSLIQSVNPIEELTIQELFRLHKIKLPTKVAEGSINERFLNKKEQDLLVQIINAVFEYTIVKDSDTIEKLISIIGKIHELRKIQLQALAIIYETFAVQHIDITFTIRIELLIKQEIPDFERWREGLKESIERYGHSLRDYPSGVLTLPILGEKWVVQKSFNTLTLLSKQMDMVSIE